MTDQELNDCDPICLLAMIIAGKLSRRQISHAWKRIAEAFGVET